jgi:hypothetical protein
MGADRYADIEYRIWIDESDLGEEAAGLLTGDEHALRNAFVANSVVLSLEDGTAIEVRVTSIAPGQGRAGIDVVGPIQVLTVRPTARLH